MPASPKEKSSAFALLFLGFALIFASCQTAAGSTLTMSQASRW